MVVTLYLCTFATQMTLHIFNPEHDIALAFGKENFTAPHAGRQLRHDLGFLPALWAAPGDFIFVEDVEMASSSLQRFAVAARKYLGVTVGSGLRWFNINEILPIDVSAVAPWGWDMPIRARLDRMDIPHKLLPTSAQLWRMRELSHRRTAASLLQRLADDGLTTGISAMPVECTSVAEVEQALQRTPHAVLKAPWSSSGRGLRFVGTRTEKVASASGESLLQADRALEGWLRGVLARQGSVMVEPYYNKVKDFGMEFEALADGSIVYRGLSLFHTANGAYKGNVVATEQRKREMVERYFTSAFLDRVKDCICNHLADMLRDCYQGPLGVDMMVMGGDDGFLLHPCVEINLRRTMGHVALALTPADDDRMAVMRIAYANGSCKATLSRVDIAQQT